MRPRLTPAQERETLLRHGYPEDTPVLGVSYTDEAITVNIAGARLIVPPDVLTEDAVPAEPRRRTLFSRPD